MKPQVPEGMHVEYSYLETHRTPFGGRSLARPHRAVVATLIEDGGEWQGFPLPIVRGVGVAVAKEGPLADDTANGRHCSNGLCSFDQFNRKIGRAIALGRAVKDYQAAREREAEVAA